MTEVARPAEPELRATLSARLILDFTEYGEHHHVAEEGVGRLLDNGWLLWLSDEGEEWQCWPPHAVLCIDWRPS